MDVVCIDTQILSWAIVKKPPNSNPNLVHIATDFMQWVQDQNFTVIVPTIIVSELLIPVPIEDHPRLLQLLSANYRIVPFDLPSARKMAEMRQAFIIQNRLRVLLDPNRPDATKAALKADVMIIATALAHGAQALYSHNTDMRNMAKDYITAFSLDDVPFQRSFGFNDGDSNI